MNAHDFIDAARQLAEHERGKPKQVMLRRALSTAYYATFHCLAKCCADLMVGGTNALRSKPAWRQAYRALEHGFAKSQCKDTNIIGRFPQDVQDFATTFVELQIKRHSADYDPHASFTKSEVETDISKAETAINAFSRVPIKHRRAFCAWVLFRHRKSEPI